MGQADPFSWRRTLLFAALGLLLVCGLGYTHLMLQHIREPSQTAWNGVHIGDSEGSVRRLLGEPYREYRVETAPADYYLSGYARRERSISNRVLIYVAADLVLYVWIAADDRVEELFTGSS